MKKARGANSVDIFMYTSEECSISHIPQNDRGLFNYCLSESLIGLCIFHSIPIKGAMGSERSSSVCYCYSYFFFQCQFLHSIDSKL